MTEFKNEQLPWEDNTEEMVPADQADKAIAEAVKKALAEANDETASDDEAETER